MTSKVKQEYYICRCGNSEFIIKKYGVIQCLECIAQYQLMNTNVRPDHIIEMPYEFNDRIRRQ